MVTFFIVQRNLIFSVDLKNVKLVENIFLLSRKTKMCVLMNVKQVEIQNGKIITEKDNTVKGILDLKYLKETILNVFIVVEVLEMGLG